MASSGTTPIRATVLGPVAIESRSGGLVEPSGSLAKCLVVALVLARGRPLSVSALVDELWEDDPPRQEKAALQTLVSRLRSVCADGILESGHGGYALVLDSGETDLSVAERLAESARAALASGDHASAEPRVAEALALWTAEPGSDLPETQLAAELRDRAGTVRDRLVRMRAECALGLGRARDAVDLLESLTAAAPLDEELHALLMRSLAAAGRRADALGVFAALRTRLRDDLGTSPSPEIVALNADLLKDEPPTPADTAGHMTIGLRTAPNELLGRENDILAVQRSIRTSRLTTILGPGGIGKTRLAQEVGRREAEHTPAVIVVELASVRSDEDVTLVLASTLGIGDARSGRLQLADPGVRIDVRDRILAALGSHRTLLVMDNCEHIVDAAAAWIADILAATTSVRVLATSRAPLSIGGENVYQLEPLATTDDDGLGPAVTLFMERARAARATATLPVDVIARLCARLDGLPLAIELAAARARSMSVEEIERRLNNRFALLKSRERTAPERHRTLQAVIDWSWNLLADSERRLLRRLSPFPDGFGVEAAQVVGADGGTDALDDLDGLVAQSLVSVAESPDTGIVRYRMLETVREFGDLALVEAGESELARRRMISWAHGFASSALDGLDGRDQVRAFAIVTAEQENLVAVLRMALDAGESEAVVMVFALLSYFWTMRGAHSDVAAFAPAILRATRSYRPDAAHRDAAIVAYTISAGTFLFGNRREALRARSRLRALKRSGPSADARLETLSTLVLAADDMQKVLGLIAEYRASSNRDVALLGHMFNAQMMENTGDIDRSLADALRGYELAVQTGSIFSQANASQMLTELYSQSGMPEEALHWAGIARAGLSKLRANTDLQQVDWAIALNEIALGRVDGARTKFEMLVKGTDDDLGFDFVDLRAIGWSGLAEIALFEGRTDDGLELYRRAIKVFEDGPRRRSPWYSVQLSACVADHVRAGWPDHAWIDAHARRLRTTLRADRRSRRGYVDLPVAGTVILGLSAWLLSPDRKPSSDAVTGMGLQLLVLSGILHGRQDLPSLHRDRHEAAAVAAHGEAALADARSAVGGLGREEAVERTFELLADRRLLAPFVPSGSPSCLESG